MRRCWRFYCKRSEIFVHKFPKNDQVSRIKTFITDSKCPLFTVTPNLEIDLFLGDMSLICSIRAIKLCQLCQKQFHGSNSARDYKRHLQKHKKEAQGRINHCKFCNKSFEVKFNYKRHSNSRKCLNNQANYYKIHGN